MEKLKQRIQHIFQNADSLIISAGAGMGVDSGLPDFRGNQGMWQAYPELGRQKMDFSDIANPKSFQKQPRLAWGFYGHRLDLYRKTEPHQGFYQLLKLSQQRNLPYFVFTSNVDGQFQKAGFAPELIYECHGSIHALQCSTPCCNHIWRADEINDIAIDHQSCKWLNDLPRCPYCHTALARSNILMFDDFEWRSQQSNQQATRLKAWLKSHSNPVVIEIGTGTAIPTVRGFSENFAPQLIRINPREAHLPRQGGIALEMGAKNGIEFIINALS